MNFIDIYRFAEANFSEKVSVKVLIAEVAQKHASVNEIVLFKCDLNISRSRGHMVLFLDRSSGYGEDYIVASIRYSKNNNRCWARFVCCKELMHVFDSTLARTSNKADFIELLSELENNPINVAASDRFTSERVAEWQALFVMCPRNLRQIYKHKFEIKEMSVSDIAEALLIPEVYVRTIISDRYEKYHELIIGEPV